MLLRRYSSHVRDENWFAVFLDLIVVVVGLFIGLQIDTWWEDRKEARLEGAYLLEIQEDFELNKLALEEMSAKVTVQVQNTHEMELVQIYEPYIIENLDYSAVAIGRVDDFP